MHLKLLPSTEGVLEGSIEWGGEEDLDPALVHAITVPLAPLRLSERAHDEAPIVRLHSIRVAVRSWRELGNKTFSFPNVVRRIDADGGSNAIYDIYGSLRLGAEYHQVLMTHIAFGQYEGCRVAASLKGSVRSVANPPLFAPAEFSCNTSLSVGPVFIRGDVGSNALPALTEAEELTQRLLRLRDYEPPRNENGRVLLSPSCPG